MKKIMKLFALSSLMLATSCGNGNSDNLEILNANSAFPEINAFATGVFNTGQSFIDERPYWLFVAAAFNSYLAPARGIVAEIGVSQIIPSTNYVTLIHSARLSTRVHGISVVNARAGDAVVLSQAVGIFSSSTNVAFQVLLDGVPVCPLSFVSADLRRRLMNNPCQ